MRSVLIGEFWKWHAVLGLGGSHVNLFLDRRDLGDRLTGKGRLIALRPNWSAIQ